MNKGLKILIIIAAIILMWATVIGVALFLNERRSTCEDGPPPRGEQFEEHWDTETKD